MSAEAVATTPSMLRRISFLWESRAWSRHPGNLPEGWMQGQCLEAARAIDSALVASGTQPREFEGDVYSGPMIQGEAATDPMTLAALVERWVRRASGEVDLALASADAAASDHLLDARQHLRAVLSEFG